MRFHSLAQLPLLSPFCAQMKCSQPWLHDYDLFLLELKSKINPSFFAFWWGPLTKPTESNWCTNRKLSSAISKGHSSYPSWHFFTIAKGQQLLWQIHQWINCRVAGPWVVLLGTMKQWNNEMETRLVKEGMGNYDWIQCAHYRDKAKWATRQFALNCRHIGKGLTVLPKYLMTELSPLHDLHCSFQQQHNLPSDRSRMRTCMYSFNYIIWNQFLKLSTVPF